MSTNTSTSITPQENWSRITGESFIKALNGEKIKDARGKEFTFNKLGNRIKIDKVIVSSDIKIFDLEIGEIVISENCVFEKKFNFYNLKVDKLDIKGGIFKERVSISNGKGDLNLTISGGTFKKELWSSVSFSGFKISGGSFSAITLYKVQIKNDFIISGGTFDGVFRVSRSYLEKDFRIEKGTFKKKLALIDGKFNRILIKNQFSASAKVDVISIKSLNLSINFNAELEIEKAEINELLFRGSFSASARCRIKKISFQNLIFKEVINEGDLSFHDCEKLAKSDNFTVDGGLISLINSELGKLSFFNTDLPKFEEFQISGCNLLNVRTIDQHIPLATQKGNLFFTHFVKNKKSQKPSSLSETYNQLHLAMQKSGNKDWEDKYYGEFMHWRLKGLAQQNKQVVKEAWNKKKPRVLKSLRSMNQVLLWLNKVSNRFSQSWSRGFASTIVISIILYLLYYANLCRNEEVSIAEHLGNWVRFVNPTHKFNFMVEAEKPTGKWSYFIDGVSRVLISFFIYQTVAASRRFGKA